MKVMLRIMVRNKVLQIIRDLVILVFSLLGMASSYGKWVTEQAHYILFYAAVIFFGLSTINIILLLVLRMQKLGYYKFNAIFQILLSLGLISTLFQITYAIHLILNIIVIATLKEKK
jgi:hypothetical protein